MSLHSSLKIDTAGSQQRTVLSRIERIKDLMKKGRWSDEHSVTALPKLKVVRIKARKTKAKEEGAEGAAATAASGSPDASKAAAGKTAAPAGGKPAAAKVPAAKSADKK